MRQNVFAAGAPSRIPLWEGAYRTEQDRIQRSPNSVDVPWMYHESSCRHMEDVHSATPALPLGTFFLTI